MSGDLFSKKRNKTSRMTVNRSENRAAEFHAPGSGRRTPLSGSNSGVTHADCMYVPGLFIEAKLRAKHAIWTTYVKTKRLARLEGLVPVITLFQKYEKGFIDCVHSDYIDLYVQRLTQNRRITVQEPDRVMFGETELINLYEGSPSEIETLIKYLNTRSFNEHGELNDNWYSTKGDKLELYVIVKSSFKRVLYGRFPHPFKKKVKIDRTMVAKGIGEIKRAIQ